MSLIVNNNLHSINSLNSSPENRSFEEVNQSEAKNSNLELNENKELVRSGIVVDHKLVNNTNSLGSIIKFLLKDIIGIQNDSSAIEDQETILRRMEQLATQGEKESLEENERRYINEEFNSLKSDIDNLAHNRENLLNSSELGKIDDTTVSLNEVDLSSVENAQEAVAAIENSFTQLETLQSDLESTENQNVISAKEQIEFHLKQDGVKNQIRDIDFAKESENFSKNQLLEQNGDYKLAQANVNSEQVLDLLV